MLRGYIAARSGNRREAEQIRASFLDQWTRTKRGAQAIAVVDAGLGDIDSAFVWLNRAIDDQTVTFYIMMPLFKELHADPRFEEFNKRLRAQKR